MRRSALLAAIVTMLVSVVVAANKFAKNSKVSGDAVEQPPNDPDSET